VGDRRTLFWLGATSVVHVAALALLYLAREHPAGNRPPPRVVHFSVDAMTIDEPQLPAWLRETTSSSD